MISSAMLIQLAIPYVAGFVLKTLVPYLIRTNGGKLPQAVRELHQALGDVIAGKPVTPEQKVMLERHRNDIIFDPHSFR